MWLMFWFINLTYLLDFSFKHHSFYIIDEKLEQFLRNINKRIVICYKNSSTALGSHSAAVLAFYKTCSILKNKP